MTNRVLLLSDVSVALLPSPHTVGDVDTSTSFITLGSSGYNTASVLFESIEGVQVRFASEGSAIIVEGLEPIKDPTYGFIEKEIDGNNGGCFFYAAGLSVLGTTGAAYHLATEWRRLRRRYGDEKGFIVMLRFDPNNYRRWSIVFEKETPRGKIPLSIAEKSTTTTEGSKFVSGGPSVDSKVDPPENSGAFIPHIAAGTFGKHALCHGKYLKD